MLKACDIHGDLSQYFVLRGIELVDKMAYPDRHSIAMQWLHHLHAQPRDLLIWEFYKYCISSRDEKGTWPHLIAKAAKATGESKWLVEV